MANAVIFDPPTSLIQWETVSGISTETDILYSTAISHCMSVTMARKGPGEAKHHYSPVHKKYVMVK